MKNSTLLSMTAAAAFVTLTGAAFAQSSAVATTDLNVRAGPGPQYPVIGVIGAGQGTTIDGCIEGSKWCQVQTGSGAGWAYSDYLTGDFGGQTVEGISSPPPEQVRTYVQSNQVDPVYLDGEVVVGAALPETVTLSEIPDYEYRYVYVNGQSVLVEPQSRRIVYVVR